MTWAYSSNVYTQSSTDADPGSLASEDGGSSRFNGLQEVVSVQAGRHVRIDGTLTVDPERFLLRVEHNQGVDVRSGGTLHLGLEKTANGVTRTAKGAALVVGRAPSQWWGDGGNRCSIKVSSGGSLTIRGSSLLVSSLGVIAGSSALIEDGRIITQDLPTGTTDPQTGATVATGSGFYTGADNVLAASRGFISWIRSTDVYIDGFVIEGGGELIVSAVPSGMNGVDSTLTNGISGVVTRGMRIGLFPNRVQEIEFANTSIGGNGNFVDVPIQSEGGLNDLTHTTLKNEMNPGSLNLITVESGNDNRNHGAVSLVREVQLNGVSGMDVVQGGMYWIRDNEHAAGPAYITGSGGATLAIATTGICTFSTPPATGNMRVGHYVRADGTDYEITNISGSTITVDPPASAIAATSSYSIHGSRVGAAIYKPSSGNIVKTYNKAASIPGNATLVADDRERKVFTGSLDASGNSPLIDILTAAVKVGGDSRASLTNRDRAELTWNLRGKDNDLNSAKFDVHFWHPEYLYWTTEIDVWNNTTGIFRVSMSLAEDENYTATGVISVCATTADIYSAIKQLKISSDAQLILPTLSTLYASYSHATQEIDFGSYNVVLNTTATEVISVSDTTITVKCAAVLRGNIVTSGTVTLEGVRTTGSIEDVNGVIVTVVGYTAGHRAVAAAWPASQGTLNRANIITASNYITRSDASITAATNTLTSPTTDFGAYIVGNTLILSGFANDENNGSFTIATIAANGRSCTLTRVSGSFVDESAGETVDIEDGTTTSVRLLLAANSQYYFVGDAVSYLRSSALLIDTGVLTTIVGSLRRIVDTEGNDLIPLASSLTEDEKNQLALIGYNHASDRITFGANATTNEFTFRAVARAIELGQSSPNAMSNPYICRISEGSFTLENDSNRTISRASGVPAAIVPDLSSFQFSKTGSTDQKDFVDYEDGAIIVNSGVPAVVSVNVEGTSESNFHSYMNTLPGATKATFKSSGDEVVTGMTALEAWRFLTGIGGGRVAENAIDSSKLDIYSPVDDSLVATIPKFVGEARAAGATVPP